MKRPITSLLVIATGLLGLTWQAYSPGLDGPFLVDDFPNITTNDAVKINELTLNALACAAESGRAGPAGRPLSMLSFAVDHARSGLNPSAFKRSNLIIHLVCGLLVAQLSFLLSSRIFWRHASQQTHRHIALLTMGVWLLHPLQLTNVLYVVQRMNSLSSLFMLGAIALYVSRRFRPDGQFVRPGIATIATVLALTLCAILSKENGILALGYIAVIELSARYTLSDTSRTHADRVFLAVTAIGTILLAIGLFAFWDRLIGAYANRDFTLKERLLTESRALIWYLRLLFIPDLSEMALLHDDWVKSTSITQPITTLTSILMWLATVTTAWLVRFRAPVLLFGVLWFLVGHSIESTVWPLLLVFEHRNYAPIFGVIVAVLILTAQATSKWSKALPAIGAAVMIGLLFNLTRERANTWSDNAIWIQAQARHHPMSPSAQYFKGILFAQFASYVPAAQREKVIQTAAEAFERAIQLDPADISPILARAYHWTKLGISVPDDDFKIAAARLSRGNNVPFPAQNATLKFCEHVREGAVPYRGAIYDDLFTSLLDNQNLAPFIRKRLQPCAKDLRHRPPSPTSGGTASMK